MGFKTPEITGIPSDSANLTAVPTRSLPQEVARIGFTKVVASGVDPDWGAVVGSIGSGMTVSQSGGTLLVTAGTTARSETIIRSIQSWEGGIRMRVRSTLSQRIANNNFFAELVDVIGDGLAYTISSATVMVVTIPSNPFTADNVGQSLMIGGFSGTGTFLTGRYTITSVSVNNVTFAVSAFAAGTGTCSVFGWNYYQLLYNGANGAAALFDTQRKGYATGFGSAITINTTAAPGHLAIITGNDLAASFADQLVATSAGVIQQTVRATRSENVPDDFPLRMQIRVHNGTTAPASGTTWTIGFVSVSNYANQDVTIQDVRPMGVATGLPVEILRTIALPVTVSSGNLNGVTTVSTIANGQTAHSAAATGSPMRIGGRVLPATPDLTLVAGDASDVGITTGQQALIKPFSSAELDFTFSGSISASTTAVVFKNAAGASIRNFVTGITLNSDTLTAATEVVIKDGAITFASQTIASNIITSSAAHDLKIGDQFVASASTITGLTAGTIYYVLTVPSTTTLTLSAVPNGSTLAISGTGVTATANRILFRTKLQTTSFGPTQFTFNTPLRGTPNSTLDIQTVTSTVAGSVYYNIQGFIGF